MDERNKIIEVRDLSIGYGDRTILSNLNFDVYHKEILFILGNSGCGKSTLLKHLIGLYQPQAGDIKIFGDSIVNATEDKKLELRKKFGVTYQGGALFGSMSVADNVAFPLREHTDLTGDEIAEIVEEKLSLANLAGYGSFMPAELSGGMKKRAGLARALALSPKLLFFDEPSAGLDPLASATLDALILELRDTLDATVVVVSHELDSIFSTADRIIMLDKERKTIVASGDPRALSESAEDPWVRNFLLRNNMKRG
jgi:phospholipid/cholesterol/gamma-HCH transport system ATP-binding protein